MQLAGWEELLLVAIGLVLLAVEIFVIPGFGVVGALGIVALLGGLALSLVGAGATTEVMIAAVSRIVMALLVALLAGLLLLRFFPRLPFARRLVLDADLGTGPGHGSAPESDQRWLGKQGRAASVLRPAGIAEFDGERVDVVADGVLIEAGEPIEVIRVDGNRIVVRRAASNQKERLMYELIGSMGALAASSSSSWRCCCTWCPSRCGSPPGPRAPTSGCSR